MLSDTYKHKRRQLKQLEEDLRNMEDAFNSMNNDERAYEELISEKLNKIIQTEKDLDQLREKVERATKQVMNYSRDLRKSMNSDGPTLEEKDFNLRDLWDFNKNKVKDLVDLSVHHPIIQQTLTILFAQANIPMPGGSAGSVASSSRSSRDSSRRNSTSSSINSAANSERASSRNGAKPVNIGFGK